MQSKDRLEFVIPVFEEEECLPELLKRLLALREKMTAVEMGFVFVNDGSRDSSLQQLLSFANLHPFVKVISFSRNFGHQAAVTAGLDHSRADFICIIDADLQDPPELAELMYRKAKAEDLRIVYGQRKDRKGETSFKKLTAALFYKLLRRMCQIDIPANTGDFRLIDRKVAQGMREMRESSRFLRGMFPWTGFRSAPVLYDRDPRYAGTTKYPFLKMFKFAVDAILSFSNVPLRAASYAGISLVSAGLLGLFYMLWLKFFTDRVVPGIMVILVGMFTLGGFQILMLGLIGEYIGRVFEQVKGRPIYFIDLTRNVEGEAGG